MQYFLLLLSAHLLIGTRAQGVAPKIKMSDGHEIPQVGLGTWKTGTDTYQAVLDAIDAGFRHIDTSPMYNSEKDIGRAVAKAIADGKIKREDIFITTKLDATHARANVVPAIKQSLANLGMTYVDLYLVHFPGADVDTWHGMEDAYEQGLTKSIGISNYHTAQVDTILAAAKVKPVNNQVDSSPYHHQSQMLSYLKGKSISMTAYSPLGGDGDVKKLIAEPKIVAIANAHNVSGAQVVLRYQIERGVIVIPEATKKAHILEDINLFNFKLTDAEIKDVETLTKDNGAFWSVLGS